MLEKIPVPDGGPDALEPDSYDAEGHLTINSWQLFKEDELAHELDNEDQRYKS